MKKNHHSFGHYSNTPVLQLVAPKSHLIVTKGDTLKLIVNEITKSEIEAINFRLCLKMRVTSQILESLVIDGFSIIHQVFLVD